jgi:hypothetical protein
MFAQLGSMGTGLARKVGSKAKKGISSTASAARPMFRSLGSLGASSQARMASVAKDVGNQSTAAASRRANSAGFNRRRKASQLMSGQIPSNTAAARSRSSYTNRVTRVKTAESMKAQQIAAGKKRAVGIGALGAVGIFAGTNRNDQQTMYRGPMQTGRGVGRYS